MDTQTNQSNTKDTKLARIVKYAFYILMAFGIYVLSHTIADIRNYATADEKYINKKIDLCYDTEENSVYKFENGVFKKIFSSVPTLKQEELEKKTYKIISQRSTALNGLFCSGVFFTIQYFPETKTEAEKVEIKAYLPSLNKYMGFMILQFLVKDIVRLQKPTLPKRTPHEISDKIVLL